MATIEEALAGMSEDTIITAIDEVLVIDPVTRQINIPGNELVFGVEHDGNAERKYFQCSRRVGNNIDLASCFLRANFRNANGEIDFNLINDVAVSADGATVTFSWELSPKATAYKGQTKFVICATRPGANEVSWHTTQATGIILEGLEPDIDGAVNATNDGIAELVAMVDAQTVAVENTGAGQVQAVKTEGATQIQAVKTASETAQASAVAEIEAKGVNTRNSIPDDYTAMQSAVDALTRGRAGAIVCETAGETVCISDASDLPMQGLRIFGRSTQDGTPTPDAPVEIVSVVEPVVTVYGGNLLPYPYAEGTSKEMNGITFTVRDDGSIMVNGTATDLAFFTFNYTGNRKPLPNGWLAASTGLGYGADVVQIQNDIYMDGEYYTSVQTVTEGSAKRQILDGVLTLGASRIKVNTGVTVNNAVVYPMLCNSETVFPYEHGKAVQNVELTHTLPGIPVTSGGNYTDSEGQQWICDEIDLERGVYVQRVKEQVINRTPYFAETADLPGRFNWYCLSGEYKNGRAEAVLNFAKWSAWGGAIKGVDSGGVSINQIYYTPAVTMTVDEVNAKFAKMISDGTQPVIMGQLETPIETPLSETELAAYRALHSNYPNTTVLNDSGAHMVVKYAADTKLYIDNKITALLGG